MHRKAVPIVTTGYVRFPIYDKRYTNTREGGMQVWLLAVPYGEWSVCCGPSAILSYNENLIGTDTRDNRDAIVDGVQTFPLEDKLFPRYKEWRTKHGVEPYLSVACLAALCLGTTSWSGWDERLDTMWRCKLADLSERGESLYTLLCVLYGKRAKILLTTWLDT